MAGGEGDGGPPGAGEAPPRRQPVARTPWQLFRLHCLLLIWKNGVLQKRRPISTCVEICLPILFVLSLVGIRLATLDLDSTQLCVRPMPKGVDNKPTYFFDCEWDAVSPIPAMSDPPGTTTLFESLAEQQCRGGAGSGWVVGYAPAGGPADGVMRRARDLFASDQGLPNVTLAPFATEADMVASLVPQSYQAGAPYSCVFGVAFAELDARARTAEYALRFDSTPGYWYGSPSDPVQTLHNDVSWLTDRSFPAVILSVGPRIEQATTLYTRASNQSSEWWTREYNAMGGTPGYPQNGFLPVQAAVNQALLETFGLASGGGGASGSGLPANETLRRVKLNRIPFPAYKNNTFALVIQGVLPLFLVLALLFTAISIAKSVVDEKESQLTETFKMMGITAATQWLSWFLQYVFFLSISVFFAVLLLKLGMVLENSDWSLLFVYLMLFATSSITLMFIVSVFFSKASTAAAVAGLVWFASYLPYRALTPRWNLLTPSDKTAACLLSTTCMAIGANVIGEREGDGFGVTWANMYDPVSADDPFTFAAVLSMLFADTILYSCVVLYLDAVIPSELGVKQPWYFVLLPSFWASVLGLGSAGGGGGGGGGGRGYRPLSVSADATGADDEWGSEGSGGGDGAGYFQPVPDGEACGLELRGLRKVFGSGKGAKVAVVGSTLRMAENEITALLGHNGAGKTTTMSIICGLIPPTSGAAVINGYDIRTDLRVAQSQLGLCPQRNTLLPSLTVTEHLWLFAKLKGVSDKHVYRDIDQMLADIELLEKRHATAGTLSGGMKRKLSCALALVGGSPVVILDEPTSGCDPSARRAIWDLLLRNRAGRTMLLSTHHMDEADVLPSRVAIMVNGRVACAGTPLALKSHYGIGYKLSLVTDPARCSVEEVTHAIQSIVPSAVLANAVIADLSYALARDETALFPKLFAVLECDKEQLGIVSFGIAGASIEDVFLKVGDGADDPDLDGPAHLASSASTPSLGTSAALGARGDQPLLRLDVLASDPILQVDDNDDRTSPLLGPRAGREDSDDEAQGGGGGAAATGVGQLALHLRAMFFKRIYHLRRNKLAIVPQLLVPSAFVLFALVIAKTYPGMQPLPARDLSALATHYGDGTTVVLSNTTLAGDLGAGGGVSVAGLGATAPNMSWALLQYACATQSTGGIAECAAPDIAQFNRRNMVALDTPSGGNWTAWFNGQAYHTPAEAYALATNVVLNTHLPEGAPRGRISTVNHPLPRTPAEELDKETNNGLGFSVALMVIFGMSFLVAYFIIFPVTERASKAKRMQLLSGVHLGVFWGTSAVFDFANFVVPAVINVALFAAFAVPSYSGPQLGYVVVVFLAYGLAAVPTMYAFSFVFDDAATAYSRAVLLNVVTGIGALLTIFILQATSNDPTLVPTLKNWFLIFPNFCFGQAFVDMYSNFEVHQYKDQLATEIAHGSHISCAQVRQFMKSQSAQEQAQYSCEDNYLALEYPGIGKYVLSLFLQAGFYSLVLVLIELNLIAAAGKLAMSALDLESVFAAPQRGAGGELGEGVGDEDSDVVAERERVLSAAEDGREDIVLLKDLVKVYKLPWCSGEVEAVQGLSMGVSRGQCFGLLGVNGAGKSSTFKMLTGDETITAGTALMNGCDAATDMNAARKHIGYAPQFDALIELMTGRELITMFAYLRGIAPARVPGEVDRLIRALSLQRHADRVCKHYSGGNKRKLSTAMALIGRPPIVLLDEPTTGLDPLARRALWRALTDAMRDGQSIILTSHSMEECDALCSTIGIMVNGQFKCFGTPQRLKSKFGKGGSITVAAANKPQAMRFLQEKFPGGDCTDDHSNTFTYSILNDIALTELFTTMESAKQSGVVHDYSISQTTLEQVFIQFARDQTETEAREHAFKNR